MASFRGTMSLMQRDGAGEHELATSDSFPSPKLSHTASVSSLDIFVVLDRIQSAVAGIFFPRSSRPKPKGQLWKRAFFHFFVCFVFGLLIGFTPFPSVDFSKNFVSKYQTFSFEVDPTTDSAHRHIDIVSNGLTGKLAFKDNVSSVTMSRWEMRREAISTPYVPVPFQDLDLECRKLLIIVTPTYARPFQSYYINRLAHTLKVVPPPLLWIVVEMSSQSPETAEILRETGVTYRHLMCDKNVTEMNDGGIHQRNVALSHIEKHQLDGIVYFANNNNIYSVGLFVQMREIRRFGTWPVAMLIENKNQVVLEGPVCNGSQVIGWHSNERNRITRRFHVDMSGFAFNSTILWDPKRWHRPTLESIRHLDTVRKGLQASTFIEQLVEDESQMEGLPKGCSRIMVWHLNLEAPGLFFPQGWSIQKNLEVVAPLT